MAPSRGVETAISQLTTLNVCGRCLRRRSFATTPSPFSGHNRWSKIKHDKGKNDAAKNRQRSFFAQEITTASKLFGPDANSNPRLAGLINKAKREGFAKASIETAIARGQGRSASGASLESVTIEGILPNNVAVIVDCETDNKARTMMDVRLVMKEAGGSATPAAYLFEKRGRVVFEKKDGVSVDDAMEPALDGGALDVEEDENGRIWVTTEPQDVKSVGDKVANLLGLHIATSEILWQPIEETRIGVSHKDAASELGAFIDKLLEKESSVQSVAMNVAQGNLDVETWRGLQDRLIT